MAMEPTQKTRLAVTNPFENPPLPDRPGHIQYWGRLYGSSTGLVISQAAERHHGPVVVVTPDTATAQRLDLITSELQEAIMLTRMQSIGNVFNNIL